MASSFRNSQSRFIRDQLGAVVSNSSVVVKFICISVILSYFLSFSEEAVKYLSVTPGLLLPPNFWIWTLFTNSFLEMHAIDVFIDLLVVGLCGKLLEPLWGAFEMLLFFQVVNVGVACLSSLIYLTVYMSTFNTDLLFEVHIHGLVGYIAGLSVAVKQVMPDHVLLGTPVGKLRNRHVPLLVLALTLGLWATGVLRSAYPCMYGVGTFVSWLYLRFFQRHTNGTKGDLAEGFTFASFFPDDIQYPVAIVSNTIFEGMVKLKVCQRPVRKFNVGAPSGISISIPGATTDTERRRQKALKDLEARMGQKPGDGSEWPAMDDPASPGAAPIGGAAAPPIAPSGGGQQLGSVEPGGTSASTVVSIGIPGSGSQGSVVKTVSSPSVHAHSPVPRSQEVAGEA